MSGGGYIRFYFDGELGAFATVHRNDYLTIPAVGENMRIRRSRWDSLRQTWEHLPPEPVVVLQVAHELFFGEPVAVVEGDAYEGFSTTADELTVMVIVAHTENRE